MKDDDTVEVRLRVPSWVHQKIQSAAKWEGRTTHNQYIYYLSWLHRGTKPYPAVAENWPDEPK